MAAPDLDGDVPVGGSTGLSHEHSAAIEEAAAWLAGIPYAERPEPLVPTIRAMFGLSAWQACQALREASEREGST